MKAKHSFLANASFLISLICLFISCSSVKKTAIDCPDISSNRYYKAENSRQLHRKSFARKSANTSRYSFSGSKRNRRVLASSGPVIAKDYPREIINLSKSEYNRSLTAFLPEAEESRSSLVGMKVGNSIGEKSEISIDAVFSVQPQKCDTIVLRSGIKYVGKVEEIGLSEIKYRRCDNLAGPLIAVLKSNVNVIKYSNGTNDYFTSNDYIPSVQSSDNNFSADNRFAVDTRKSHGLAIAGFVTSLAGLFIFSIPLGILSVVFGAVSLGKIRRSPSRFKGKGLAIAAIIIGLVDIVVMIALLATVTVY
jgi:hypothetical protein